MSYTTHAQLLQCPHGNNSNKNVLRHFPFGNTCRALGELSKGEEDIGNRPVKRLKAGLYIYKQIHESSEPYFLFLFFPFPFVHGQPPFSFLFLTSPIWIFWILMVVLVLSIFDRTFYFFTVLLLWPGIWFQETYIIIAWNVKDQI